MFLTSEFDEEPCQQAAEEGAAVYRRNGNLLAYGKLGGITHTGYFNFELTGADEWHNAMKAFFDKYL